MLSIKPVYKLFLVGLIILALLVTYYVIYPGGKSSNDSQVSHVDEVYQPFEPLLDFRLGEKHLLASIADTDDERSLGLSNTTKMPNDVVKVFIFPSEAQWSFWMKDMHYPIDIMWLSTQGEVVHIESDVKPESYPSSFTPPRKAMYVIETNSGLIDSLGLTVGSLVSMDDLLVQISK